MKSDVPNAAAIGSGSDKLARAAAARTGRSDDMGISEAAAPREACDEVDAVVVVNGAGVPWPLRCMAVAFLPLGIAGDADDDGP